MKTKVRSTYPLLTADLRHRLINNGWKPRSAATVAKLKELRERADYKSKGGHVRRWTAEVTIPTPPPVLCYLIGSTTNPANASQLLRITDRKPEVTYPGQSIPKIRFEGTREECEAVLAMAIRQWWTLPRGQEIESVVAARMEMPTTH